MTGIHPIINVVSLCVSARPVQDQEIQTLNEFAHSNGEQQQLEVCDVPYWRRRHKLSTCRSAKLTAGMQSEFMGNVLRDDLVTSGL